MSCSIPYDNPTRDRGRLQLSLCGHWVDPYHQPSAVTCPECCAILADDERELRSLKAIPVGPEPVLAEPFESFSHARAARRAGVSK